MRLSVTLWSGLELVVLALYHGNRQGEDVVKVVGCINRRLVRTLQLLSLCVSAAQSVRLRANACLCDFPVLGAVVYAVCTRACCCVDGKSRGKSRSKRGPARVDVARATKELIRCRGLRARCSIRLDICVDTYTFTLINRCPDAKPKFTPYA